MLKDRVDIYTGTISTDEAGGPQWSYSPSPTQSQVACTIQAHDYFEEVGEQERVTRFLQYSIMFGVPQFLRPRTKFVYSDAAGNTRTLFAQAPRDEAGRGGAFTVMAVERL